MIGISPALTSKKAPFDEGACNQQGKLGSKNVSKKLTSQLKATSNRSSKAATCIFLALAGIALVTTGVVLSMNVILLSGGGISFALFLHLVLSSSRKRTYREPGEDPRRRGRTHTHVEERHARRRDHYEVRTHKTVIDDANRGHSVNNKNHKTVIDDPNRGYPINNRTHKTVIDGNPKADHKNMRRQSPTIFDGGVKIKPQVHAGSRAKTRGNATPSQHPSTPFNHGGGGQVKAGNRQDKEGASRMRTATRL